MLSFNSVKFIFLFFSSYAVTESMENLGTKQAHWPISRKALMILQQLASTSFRKSTRVTKSECDLIS